MASGRSGLVLQDLVLGMNAHICFDLPVALVEVLKEPPNAARRRDFLAVNRATRAAVDPIQCRVARRYGPGLRLLDGLFGRVDEGFTVQVIDRARDRAWETAIQQLVPKEPVGDPSADGFPEPAPPLSANFLRVRSSSPLRGGLLSDPKGRMSTKPGNLV